MSIDIDKIKQEVEQLSLEEQEAILKANLLKKRRTYMKNREKAKAKTQEKKVTLAEIESQFNSNGGDFSKLVAEVNAQVDAEFTSK